MKSKKFSMYFRSGAPLCEETIDIVENLTNKISGPIGSVECEFDGFESGGPESFKRLNEAFERKSKSERTCFYNWKHGFLRHVRTTVQELRRVRALSHEYCFLSASIDLKTFLHAGCRLRCFYGIADEADDVPNFSIERGLPPLQRRNFYGDEIVRQTGCLDRLRAVPSIRFIDHQGSVAFELSEVEELAQIQKKAVMEAIGLDFFLPHEKVQVAQTDLIGPGKLIKFFIASAAGIVINKRKARRLLDIDKQGCTVMS